MGRDGLGRDYRKRSELSVDLGDVMKKLIAVLVIGFCSVVMAVVSVEISVPDNHVPRVVAMMEAWKDKNIHLEVMGGHAEPNEPVYSASWEFRIEGRKGENQAQYAARFVKTFMRECVKAHEYKIELERYRRDIQDVNKPVINVPDEVIQ